MGKTKSTRFNCFSPPVMLATLTIELSLALYTLWRYKLNGVGRLAVVTLVMLGSFQLCEYYVCTGSVGHVSVWSRLGFVAITTLPPLGLHLMHVLAGKTNRRLVLTAYATMVGFGAAFLLLPHAFSSYQCTGNYVVFHLRPHLGGVYWVYYFGWLLLGLVLGGRWANQLLRGAAARQRLQTVRALMLGWLVFVVPTAVANVVNPASRQAIPSVMCGFAVLFALILGFYILPRAGQLKQGARVLSKPSVV